MRRFSCVPLFAAALLLSACGTVSGPITAASHIAAFDSRGHIRDPHERLDTCRGSEEECAPIFDPMFTALKKYAEQRDAEGKPRRIVVFIHGGLNSTKTSIDRANRLTPEILKDGSFPILSSGDRLCRGATGRTSLISARGATFRGNTAGGERSSSRSRTSATGS